MKKYLIIFVIFSIVLVILATLLFIKFRKEIIMSKKITNIKKFELSYSKGYAMEANTIYTINCTKGCVATIKHTGSSEVKTVEINEDTVKAIEDLLNDYKVGSWDGFNKSNKHVLDGNSFHMYITTEKTHISASGYEYWPKNYKVVRERLDSIFSDIEKGNITSCSDDDVDYKPIIYLYPKEKMDISVKLGYKEKLFVTYPEYNDGWEVTAYPDGTLVEKNTNRKLYSLFWEGINTETKGVKEEGFIVRGSEVSKFLEEKLIILGLNDKEKEEFIIFWLPKLVNNEYNYIRFETKEEQDKNMPLLINPKPDTIIRINMETKPLDKKIEVKEQKLIKKERNGYAVVEWGGTILRKD